MRKVASTSITLISDINPPGARSFVAASSLISAFPLASPWRRPSRETSITASLTIALASDSDCADTDCASGLCPLPSVPISILNST